MRESAFFLYKYELRADECGAQNFSSREDC